MLDISYIRENLELVKKSVKAKKSPVDIDELLKLDDSRRQLILKVDGLRSTRNSAAKDQDIEAGKKVKEELDGLEKQLGSVEREWQKLMYQVPNIPLGDVPEGDASNYQVLKKEGKITKFAFTPKDHIELGEMLGIIDIPRAAKVSGSRFAYLKGQGVILELALVQFAMEALMKEGFVPVIPPALIKKDITEGLGYWHGGGNENYYFVRDYELEGDEKGQPLDLYLIGTGEHAVVPMHSNEVLDEQALPKKYAAFSPSFRREAGSYGQDTKGILRVHQFDKVELVEFVKPEEDETERRKMLSIVEGFMKSLKLPYRVIKLASGDLSFPAAETIDIETWIPSQEQYRETHSISTTTDFQARGLNIKYGATLGSKYVHILNGTAFAIGRMIIAILENFQTAEGSVKIPEVLQRYTGFSEITPKK